MAFTYEYCCRECGRRAEHMSEEAFCTCGSNMERIRIVGAPYIKPFKVEPGWNVGLGCRDTPQDVKNRIRELNGEQGMTVGEIGTEDPKKLIGKKPFDDVEMTDAAGEWVSAIKEADRA